MFDVVLRRALDRPLRRAAAVLDRPGITPDMLTLAGLVLGCSERGHLETGPGGGLER